VEHGGSLGGYRAHIIRFRDERFSVVALCNLASIAPGTLTRRVVDISLGDRLKPAPAAGRAAPARPSRAAGERYEPVGLVEFAGRYVSDELESVYEITVDNDLLRLRRGHQRQVLSLQPGPRDEFSVAGGTIRFVRNAAGRVEGLTVDAGRARGMRFDRQ